MSLWKPMPNGISNCRNDGHCLQICSQIAVVQALRRTTSWSDIRRTPGSQHWVQHLAAIMDSTIDPNVGLQHLLPLIDAINELASLRGRSTFPKCDQHNPGDWFRLLLDSVAEFNILGRSGPLASSVAAFNGQIFETCGTCGAPAPIFEHSNVIRTLVSHQPNRIRASDILSKPDYSISLRKCHARMSCGDEVGHRRTCYWQLQGPLRRGHIVVLELNPTSYEDRSARRPVEACVSGRS